MAGFIVHPLALIFAVSLVVLLGASELGRALGVRISGRGGDDVSTLEGAILGLLALMIGFTFAMALSRYEARREAVLDEANSIGTTALRARLLPAPHAAASLKLLREYVQIRLDITNFGNLLNKEWGIGQRLVNGSILTAPTADATGKLSYNLQNVSGNLIAAPLQTSAGVADVYVMMLSFRYTFQ